MKGAKVADQTAVSVPVDGNKIKIKHLTAKRVLSIISELRKAVESYSEWFTENMTQLETLTQNVYKTEATSVKSVVAHFAQSIEEKEKKWSMGSNWKSSGC